MVWGRVRSIREKNKQKLPGNEQKNMTKKHLYAWLEEKDKGVIDKILRALQNQSFANWYVGRFEEYIGDSKSGITAKDIRDDIKKLFKLP